MLLMPASQSLASRCEAAAAPTLRRVRVWLDDSAPHQGTFAHALEWALLLRLPLHAVVPALGGADVLAGCAAICQREGVAWTYSSEDGDGTSIMTRSQPPEIDFCVMSATRPMRQLRAAMRHSHAGPLLCPPLWRSFRRALILQEDPAPGQQYLENAAAVCHGAGCSASVLTLSQSEEMARGMQNEAVEVFARQRVEADFQMVVGDITRTAVPMVADWRRCSHIIVETARVGGLRRWLGLDFDNRIRNLADRYAVLPVGAAPSRLAGRLIEASATRQAG